MYGVKMKTQLEKKIEKLAKGRKKQKDILRIYTARQLRILGDKKNYQYPSDIKTKENVTKALKELRRRKLKTVGFTY